MDELTPWKKLEMCANKFLSVEATPVALDMSDKRTTGQCALF